MNIYKLSITPTDTDWYGTIDDEAQVYYFRNWVDARKFRVQLRKNGNFDKGLITKQHLRSKPNKDDIIRFLQCYHGTE